MSAGVSGGVGCGFASASAAGGGRGGGGGVVQGLLPQLLQASRAPDSFSLGIVLLGVLFAATAIPLPPSLSCRYSPATCLKHATYVCGCSVRLACFFFLHTTPRRVSDFGLIAVRESQSGYGGGDTVPSAAWTAPEVLDDQDPSVLSDVYR